MVLVVFASFQYTRLFTIFVHTLHQQVECSKKVDLGPCNFGSFTHVTLKVSCIPETGTIAPAQFPLHQAEIGMFNAIHSLSHRNKVIVCCLDVSMGFYVNETLTFVAFSGSCFGI